MTSPIEQLLDVMRALRDPEKGCPWDLEQNWRSLIPHTLEEAYEVAEAIEQGDADEVADELGDLLFQIVFYAQIAEENDDFDFDTVCNKISDKLIRRHPHVFADASVNSSAEQTEAWEKQKAKERAEKVGQSGQSGKSDNNEVVGVLSGVSTALPALTRSMKLQRRAARVGFDWPDISGVMEKFREELEEVEEELAAGGNPKRMEHEIGDVLFAAVNLARHADIDPETALRMANRRFESRFSHVENQMAAQGGFSEATLDEMEAAWQQAKIKEQNRE
ncbi:MAG: nucleoside triphosphate pyrophosphohydrolase [Gammaproteobacteria bacterium]|nr:nucleoside triphosphate pyrophosphohydrolase [Gammaproteobacteria bacterium]